MDSFQEIDSPSEVSRERAAHWAEFYEQLVAFEKQILERMLALAGQLPPDQATAVEQTNITPLRDLIAEFADRAASWRAAANGTRRQD